MEKITITDKIMTDFASWLHAEEKSEGTREKYLRDLRAFSAWLGGREPTKETATEWKEHLLGENYAPVTVNSMLGALNCFFRFAGMNVRIRFVRIQRSIFREKSRELTREEFQRLVETADRQGKTRLSLLLETICATGIRVSEVKYITVEAARAGKANISLKGKNRTILLPGKLCRKLLKYAGKQKIASGEIFLTGSGKSLSRRQIWAEMKRLCKSAGVEPGKVFPHNLRHLFATTFYRMALPRRLRSDRGVCPKAGSKRIDCCYKSCTTGKAGCTIRKRRTIPVRRRKASLLILFFPDRLSDPNNKHSILCAVLANCAVFFTVGRDGSCADAVHRAVWDRSIVFIEAHFT